MRLRADRRRIHQHFGAHQRHRTGRFGEPLIPANADTDTAMARVPDLETGIAGAEVVFLLIAGAIGNMAFAVDAHRAAIGVDHHQ